MSTHKVRTGFFGDYDENEVRRNLIREMNRAGVVRLEGHYSGGHDEGGLDEDLTCFDANGKPVEIVVPEGSYRWDLALYQAVENLLSTKFYSWALEHYVEGKVYVDLREKRAWTEGREEVSRYEDDGDPIDMRW